MPKSQVQKKTLKRQPNGEGTPEVLPSGLIRYKGRWNGQLVCGSAQKTYEAAKAAYRARLRELKNPPPKPEPLLPTVEAYMKEILNGPWRTRVTHRTMAPLTWQLAEQVYRLNVVGSDLGRLTLGQVVPRDLEAWSASLMTQERRTKTTVFLPRPMANSTKRRFLVILDTLFEQARKTDKLISINPVREASKPAEGEVDFKTLAAAEIEELLRLCDKEDPNETNIVKEKQRRIESNRRRRLICLLGLHGYGPAEMCGARYEDFDGEGLLPKKQRQRLGALGIVERDQLKTSARKAWVAVDDELRAMLSEKSEGFILAALSGKPMEPGNLRRTFAGMVKGTKFESMTPYDLRHTFAQRLLDEGVDVKTAAELMRHSVEVFLRRYVRSDRARKIEAIERLSAAKTR